MGFEGFDLRSFGGLGLRAKGEDLGIWAVL